MRHEASRAIPTPMSPSGQAIGVRKVGIPKFLRYLRDILNNENSNIIRWGHNGTSIQIFDIDGMSSYILPKYFKHRKYASFQRQLNYFGFRKWTKTQTNICTFSHEHFTRDQPQETCLIKRKNQPEKPGSRPTAPVRRKQVKSTDDEPHHEDLTRKGNDPLKLVEYGIASEQSKMKSLLNTDFESVPFTKPRVSTAPAQWLDSLFNHNPPSETSPTFSVASSRTDNEYLDFLTEEFSSPQLPPQFTFDHQSLSNEFSLNM